MSEYRTFGLGSRISYRAPGAEAVTYTGTVVELASSFPGDGPECSLVVPDEALLSGDVDKFHHVPWRFVVAVHDP